MSLVKSNGNFPSLMDEFLGRDMDGLFNWPISSLFGSRVGTVTPAVNVKEDDENFHIELAAPGMKKDDFQVTLDNCLLTITAEQQGQQEEKNGEGRYTKREFSYQSFTRSFQLPNTCEQDKIEARYQDGILHLMVPKKEEAKRKAPKMIEIS